MQPPTTNYTSFYYADGKVRTELSCLSVFDAKIANLYDRAGQNSPFYRMGRSYLINTQHISAINFQTLLLSFRQEDVKPITSTKNILKDLRDYLVERYNVGG